MRTKYMAAMLLAAVGTAAAARAGSPQAELVADYQFDDTYQSSVGTPPALTTIGPDAVLSFQDDTVRGETRRVLAFPKDDGLQLSPTTDVLADDRYSVAMRFRFDSVDGYRRILDFQNGQSDCGFYILGGTLNFFCSVTGSGPICPNTWLDVVLTRDALGNVVGYVNGRPRLTLTDTEARAQIDANHVLRFFRDNECVAACTEDSAGAVSRIRLYDDALSAEQVAALTTLACGDANSNGDINTTDALLTLKSAVGSACCQPEVCDVTGADGVSAIDALAILKAAVGQSVTLNCP